MISNSSSLSLSFKAIEVKYLLKLSAITLPSSTKVPSIIKDGLILVFCLPRISLISFHVCLLLPLTFSNCFKRCDLFAQLIIMLSFFSVELVVIIEYGISFLSLKNFY